MFLLSLNIPVMILPTFLDFINDNLFLSKLNELINPSSDPVTMILSNVNKYVIKPIWACKLHMISNPFFYILPTRIYPEITPNIIVSSDRVEM